MLDGLFIDIELEKWQKGFVNGCKAVADLLEVMRNDTEGIYTQIW